MSQKNGELQMRLALLIVTLCAPLVASAQTPPSSPQAPVAISEPALQPQINPTPDAAFRQWISSFRPRALAAGITPDTFDAAFAGIHYNPGVVEKDRNQNEFTKTLWDYLTTAVSDDRIRNGQAALTDNAALFDAIEARYGVDRHVVAAIWGLESAYGSFRGDINLIEAMATLAYEGRRGAFFETQLIAGLRILQNGDTTPGQMRGSWAGAMGHTQFMPTSFEAYAVDFTGDGRRDIWGDDPTDALASTAAYLAANGWMTGQPWGTEITLPPDFDYELANRTITKHPAVWAALGIRDLTGNRIDRADFASILLPAGAQGAAFMIFANFGVIERYNTADSYIIAVGHLANRLAGGPPIAHGWPLTDRALTFAERQELQTLLTAAGFDTKGADGLIGPNTIAGIRGYQKANGLIPDGYANLTLLERLRD